MKLHRVTYYMPEWNAGGYTYPATVVRDDIWRDHRREPVDWSWTLNVGEDE
jgi:hypothetical protein